MTMSVEIHKKLGAFRLDVQFILEGGILGLLGASGSGKSKSLQCIAGIEKPDEGYIIINGRTVFDSARHINLPPQERHVGYLFQNYALFPNMTVAENICCGMHALRDQARRQQVLSKSVAQLQLSGLENLKPSQLSGGQQQRVALARILVNEPDILLLDEPFSALDSYLKEQLMTELSPLLADFHKEVIMVTHNRDEAYQLCGELAILNNGHLAGYGPTKKLFENPGTRVGARLTGCKNIVAARKAGATLVEVPEWGLTLDAGQPVGTNLCAIGIRAHNFSPVEAFNAFPVQIVEKIEQPFEWVFKFRYAGQKPGTDLIWWRFAKSKPAGADPLRLGVAAASILLLYV